MVRLYKSNNVYSQWSEADMQEVQTACSSEVPPCTLLLICFVCRINAAEAITRMRMDLEGDAPARLSDILHHAGKSNCQIPNERVRRQT
jgi:hypothetical protein